jgi:hypothetical protein
MFLKRGVTLPLRAAVCLAVTTLCRLQLCTVLRSLADTLYIWVLQYVTIKGLLPKMSLSCWEVSCRMSKNGNIEWLCFICSLPPESRYSVSERKQTRIFYKPPSRARAHAHTHTHTHTQLVKFTRFQHGLLHNFLSSSLSSESSLKIWFQVEASRRNGTSFCLRLKNSCVPLCDDAPFLYTGIMWPHTFTFLFHCLTCLFCLCDTYECDVVFNSG